MPKTAAEHRGIGRLPAGGAKRPLDKPLEPWYITLKT
jgi:hypothetical protein